MKLHKTGIENGHIVRRSAWLRGVFMRICNRDKISDEVKKGDPDWPVYFHTTKGYFHHLGSGNGSLIKEDSEPREFEGLQHDYFCEDWEDHGYISQYDFELKTAKYKKSLKNG